VQKMRVGKRSIYGVIGSQAVTTVFKLQNYLLSNRMGVRSNVRNDGVLIQ
jgi:hypothetical protein